MAFLTGKDGSVRIGSTAIVGMGTWSMDGITVEQLDATSFQDQWKAYRFGVKDGGTISFNGHYDAANTAGQEYLLICNAMNSAVPHLRLYVDTTSYWIPCLTTNWWNGALSTAIGLPGLSSVNITSIVVGMDKSGLGTISFQAKINGAMVMATG